MREQKYIPTLAYDFLSEYYDLTIKLTMPETKFRTKLIDYVDPVAGECILEVGFGAAQNLILLKEREPKAILHGVDIDPKMKSIAEYKLSKHNLEVPLHLYDGTTLPFVDKSFDKIFSSLAFHQLDAGTKRYCLKGLYRILKPKGKLIIGERGSTNYCS